MKPTYEMSPELAVNSMLEILHLRDLIKVLEREVFENMTVYMDKNPDNVLIQESLIDGTVRPAEHVGSKLFYKGLEIHLHTEPKFAKYAIFKYVYQQYTGKIK